MLLLRVARGVIGLRGVVTGAQGGGRWRRRRRRRGRRGAGAGVRRRRLAPRMAVGGAAAAARGGGDVERRFGKASGPSNKFIWIPISFRTVVKG